MATTDQNQPMFTQAHLDEMVSSPNGHINIGPVTINWSVSLSPPQVNVSATVMGVQIGSIVLDPQHPTLTLGGSVGPVTVKITFTVDFSKRTLSYDVEIKLPLVGTKTYHGSVNF